LNISAKCPSKSIFIILSYTVSKLVHFFLGHSVAAAIALLALTGKVLNIAKLLVAFINSQLADQ